MPPKRRSKTLWVQVGDSVHGLVPELRNGEVYQALCACVGVAGAQLQAILLKQRVQHSVLEEHQILSPVCRSALDDGAKIVVAGANVDRAQRQTCTRTTRGLWIQTGEALRPRPARNPTPESPLNKGPRPMAQAPDVALCLAEAQPPTPVHRCWILLNHPSLPTLCYSL